MQLLLDGGADALQKLWHANHPIEKSRTPGNQRLESKVHHVSIGPSRKAAGPFGEVVGKLFRPDVPRKSSKGRTPRAVGRELVPGR